MKTAKHQVITDQAEGLALEVSDVYKLFFLTNYFDGGAKVIIEDELDLVDLSLEWDV
jgi:hypothetical protein